MNARADETSDDRQESLLSVKSGGLLRWLLAIAAALAVPIVPFIWFGASADLRIAEWLKDPLSPALAATSVIVLLAADIFLPVPSSLVSTFAGKMLGFWGGTAASWLGMTLGAAAAFALVRWIGRPVARRLSSDTELSRIESVADRYGVFTLILARPIPVLAEASVVLMGLMQLGWRRFIAAVSLSNL
ncbi:MAG: VTT domain-containing protein, partial [Planctomycetaceae bacterium]|nr:VTT domain-containing protein [Planctomycetaceae bacterium]